MVQKVSKSKQGKLFSKLNASSLYGESSERILNIKEKGLILLDQNVIRKDALGQCQKTLKKIDKAKLEIEQFEKIDKPAYDRWVQQNFGELIDRIRKYSLEIQEKRALIEEVQDEAFLQRITFIEAFKVIKYKREHPEEFEKSKPESKKEEDYWDETKDEKDNEEDFREDLDEFFHKFNGNFNMNEEEFESFRSDFKKKPKGKNQDFDSRLKERYRLIVQRLHPDKNKNPSQLESELWHEAQDAYKQRDLEKIDFIIALYNIRFGFIGIDSTIFDLKQANSKLEKSLKQFSQMIRRVKEEPSWLFLKLKPAKLNSLFKEASKEFKDFEKNTSVELREINNILDKWERGSAPKANQNYSKDYLKKKEDDFLNFYASF